MNQMLSKILDNRWVMDGEDVFKSRSLEGIVENLNPAFELREYQKEALGRFDFYIKEFRQKKLPIHLLYNMATGSGKTLIMAANILFLYQRGYRNFIFFVNSTNIIEKTRDNFLSLLSPKYLFAEKIKFGTKEVPVREVQNFEGISGDDINIIFTTIQGLHSRLNTPKENAITYEDFEGKDIVLISDEAHHINTLTKLKKTQNRLNLEIDFEDYDLRSLNVGEKEELKSWEGTVNKIFNKNPKNILLEFTATIDLSNTNINEKYKDKIIFQYDLKEFRNDRFSKEIEVLQADLPPIERALQAVVLSQYRRKIAEKNKLALKPVILFKANYVNQPKKRNENTVVSSEFEEQFKDKIKHLKATDLEYIKRNSRATLEKAFEYFERESISLDNLVKELQVDFEESKCIAVNSKDDSEAKQIIVNTLEDKNNEVRAIFAVNMLNEGWDVLNLFDIVRLYNTRDARWNKPGSTTMSEAQLIGRGARYFPFKLDVNQDRFKRKYDDEVDNELRILEQLYYHSAHNPKYIQELNNALIKIGIKPERTVELELKIKDDFKKTDFWKTGLIFLNDKTDFPRQEIDSLLKAKALIEHSYNLKTGAVEEDEILSDKLQLKQQEGDIVPKRIGFAELGSQVIRKAINQLEFFRFSNLIKYFPNIKSITEFIDSSDYLCGVVVTLKGKKEDITKLNSSNRLEVASYVLEQISKRILSNSMDYEGTKVFKPHQIQQIFKDKILRIDGDSERAKGFSEGLDLISKRWYAQNDLYGTSEEKDFVVFFNSMVDRLKGKYKKIALLRNERFFKIFDFDEGRAFEPDFVLFLKENNTKKVLIYQIFIEPKGDIFIANDSWKQKFLQDIEDNYNIELKWESKDYKLIGLPFYNESLKQAFANTFKKKLL